jgi:hypothetical protein
MNGVVIVAVALGVAILTAWSLWCDKHALS